MQMARAAAASAALWGGVLLATVKGGDELNVASGAPVLEEFEIARGGDFPVVPARVGNRAFNFLVDTGTKCTFLNSQSGLLGKPLFTRPERARSGRRWAGREVYVAPPMHLGGYTLITLTQALDLGEWELLGAKIDGVIGMDFLQNHVVQFDFDRGRLRFLDSVPPNAGERFQLLEGHGIRPHVKFGVADGEPKPYLLDTGNDLSVMLTIAEFGELQRARAIKFNERSVGLTFFGRRDSLGGAATRTALGPFVHKEVVVDTWAGNALGLGYLSRYLVTFDFPGGAVYLRKGRAFAAVKNRDMSGINVLVESGRFVVDYAVDASPGSKAGIGSGDVIRRIDGHRADNFSLFELRKRLSEPGRTVTLTVERGGAERDIRVKLREYRKELELLPEELSALAEKP
jgi:hypothetical protein